MHELAVYPDLGIVVHNDLEHDGRADGVEGQVAGLQAHTERPAGAPRFTLSWVAIFALALLLVMTGYDPVKLTEYSVIFSVVALPLTYLPILLVANDHARIRN